MLQYRITSQDVLDALELYIEAHGLGPVFVTTNVIPPTNGLGLWLMEFSSAFELRKLTVSWTRQSPTNIPEDVAMCTFHFLNLTDGVPDDTWTTNDYETVEERFMADLWDGINDFYDETTLVKDLLWRADGPAFKPFGASLAPTLRIQPAANVGTTTLVAGQDVSHPRLPPQVAVSVTERTAAHYTALNVEGVGTQVRNRWGRFFLPAPTAGNALFEGRLGSGVADAFAAAAASMYNACVSADLIPVMYSPTTGHAWTVDQIVVDDVLDVIRSRRYAAPQHRAVEDIAAP